MKKSKIGIIITAVILIVAGISLFAGGIVAAGGVESAYRMLDRSGIEDIFELHWDEDEFYIGNHRREHRQKDSSEKVDEEITFKTEEIESLYLDVKGADVEIGSNSNREFSIRTDGDYEMFVKNKVLHMKPKGIQKEHKILIELPILHVPEEILLKKAEIHANDSQIFINQISSKEFDLEVSSGQVTINELVAEKSEFDIGAGTVIVEYGNVHECDTNVDAGNFEYTGMILRHGDVECNLGNAEYHLEREVETYNYEIQCGAGTVNIGNESYTGLGKEHYINHQVQESFDIECNMGSVSIDSIN